jgi:hypothetical protein
MVQTADYIRVRELNHRTLSEFLKGLNSCYGNVLYHSEVSLLRKGKFWIRIYELLHAIKLFLSERDTSYTEVDNFNWWPKAVLLTCFWHVKRSSNKIIIEMANTVFSTEKKIEMYVEKLKLKCM